MWKEHFISTNAEPHQHTYKQIDEIVFVVVTSSHVSFSNSSIRTHEDINAEVCHDTSLLQCSITMAPLFAQFIGQQVVALCLRTAPLVKMLTIQWRKNNTDTATYQKTVWKQILHTNHASISESSPQVCLKTVDLENHSTSTNSDAVGHKKPTASPTCWNECPMLTPRQHAPTILMNHVTSMNKNKN